MIDELKRGGVYMGMKWGGKSYIDDMSQADEYLGIVNERGKS